ncbi:MAG: hypothetical protein JNL02_03720 [Saprospiraceae bacterium]|nr:hypothetical protein [Saprospiraceae bacterium]
MKKLFFSGWLLLLLASAGAQRSDILSDPDVVWAAEIEMLLVFDGAGHIPESADTLNTVAVLKDQHTGRQDELFYRPDGLTDHLFQMAWSGSSPVFAGNDPGRPLSLSDLDKLLVYRDTAVLWFDNESSDVLVMETGPEDCPYLRVRQLLFYRARTADFGLITLAIGPALPDGRVLFWWNVPAEKRADMRKFPSLDNPNIHWARRIRTNNVSPDLKQLHSLKQPDYAVMPDFLSAARNRAAVELFDVDWKPLSLERREQVFSRIDTLETFDFEAFEEHIVTQPFLLNPDLVGRLRLVQNWYWDDKRQMLLTRLVAVAPLQEIRSDDGAFRYWRPLFYRKCTAGR